jgi:hypothetical protein
VKRTLLIYLFLLSFIAAVAQDERKEYLQAYSSDLDINDNEDYSSFAMLDSVIDRYRIFFTGEMHLTDGNIEVRWKMLKYLYHKAGMRVHIIEAPYSLGWLLNHYMSMNDSVNYFRYASLEPTAKGRIFYKAIYMFNRPKPQEERIIIRGIDTENIMSIATKALRILFYQKPVPESLNNNITAFIEHRKKEYADTLLRKMHDDTTCRSVYTEEYSHIIAILKGLTCKNCEPLKAGATSETWLNREALLYENYLAALNEFPDAKFYGQFGKAHICLIPGSRNWFRVKGWDPVASRLNRNDDSPVKGKVCSIGLDYYYVTDEFTREDRKLLYEFMIERSNRAFVLFKLDEVSSPYSYIGKTYQYAININYDYKDELDYNLRNDHYKLMSDENYSATVVYAGYQRMNHQAIELGLASLARDMKRINYTAGIGFFFEFNPNQRLHTYRVAGWGGGRFMQLGLSPVFSTSYRRSAFFLRPEIGFKAREYSLTYAYNAKLYNRSLTGFNTHMVTLRAFLVLNKD